MYRCEGDHALTGVIRRGGGGARRWGPEISLLKRSLAVMLPLAFSIEWLCGRAGLLPAPAAMVADLAALALALVVVFHIVTHKFVAIPSKYKILFLITLAHVGASSYVNQVAPGPMIAGIRMYFVFLPMFLVPAVFAFVAAQLPWLLRFLLVLAMLQPPVVIVQRFVTGAGISSGDHVVGTLQVSSVLTFTMISSIAMCLAFYLKGKLGARALALLVGWLMIPTVLNETKATLVFLPIAIATALLAAVRVVHRPGRILGTLTASVALVAVFVVGYNLSLGMQESRSITEFVENETYKSYLYKGTNLGIAEVGAGEVHRFDSIAIAVKTLAKDPALLAVGLGPGNVTDSIVPRLDGRFAARFANFRPQMTSITQLLWELGLVGLGLLLAFCSMIIRDAWVLRKEEGELGPFGIGWCCVVVIFVVALPYTNMIGFVSVATLFWLGSGCVATLRYRYDVSKVYGQTTICVDPAAPRLSNV